MKLEGPSVIEGEEEQLYECSILSSSEEIVLKWKINGNTSEGVRTVEHELNDNQTVTIKSELSLEHSDSDQVNLICFVDGQGLEYHLQKNVKVKGVSTTTDTPDVLQIVERETSDEELETPDGFILVDIDMEGEMETGLANVTSGCGDSDYECCPDQVHPQHGSDGYGCCASSQFGCCPDNITPAPAPFFDVSSWLSVNRTSHHVKRGQVGKGLSCISEDFSWILIPLKRSSTFMVGLVLWKIWKC